MYCTQETFYLLLCLSLFLHQGSSQRSPPHGAFPGSHRERSPTSTFLQVAAYTSHQHGLRRPHLCLSTTRLWTTYQGLSPLHLCTPRLCTRSEKYVLGALNNKIISMNNYDSYVCGYICMYTYACECIYMNVCAYMLMHLCIQIYFKHAFID